MALSYFFSKHSFAPLIGNRKLETVVELYNLFEITKDQHFDNVGIFVSIGGGALIKTSGSNDQQYPPLMRKWRQVHPLNSCIIIIVIDPEMEKYPPSEPYNVPIGANLPRTKKNKYFEGQLCDYWSNDPNYNNVYHNQTLNIHIVSIGGAYYDFVDHYIDFTKPAIDGKELLPYLNHKAIENNWFLYVNNFTGDDIENIYAWCTNATPLIKSNLSHIVYGDADNKSKCLPDMASSISTFAFFEDNKKIRIFNIHNHLNELSSLKFLKEYCIQQRLLMNQES